MTDEMVAQAITKAQKMSTGRSHMDMVVNGAVVLLSNGKELIVDYMAASWVYKGFWIASIFEDGHRVEA